MQEIPALLVCGADYDLDVACDRKDRELVHLRGGRGAGAAVVRAAGTTTAAAAAAAAAMAGSAALVVVMVVVRARGGDGRRRSWWWCGQGHRGAVCDDGFGMGDH